MITAKGTPTGDLEAEVLFQRGLDHHMGRHGRPYDPVAARDLYLKAMDKGNAKAALNLGRLSRLRAERSIKKNEHLKEMVGFFVQAAKMGSADALYCLHEACEQGLGLPKDNGKSRKLLREAAQNGSVSAMMQLGLNYRACARNAEARQWLQKASGLGHADAAYYLAPIIQEEGGSSREIIDCLRIGADKGSKKCMRRLVLIYELGQYGQPPDARKAEFYLQLLASLET